ncbi:MAG: hypothetical protein U9Q83_04780 [Bacteroidota bacterium]|nr:hypothetical protein [Bacteroidota bacterium]
MSYKLTIEQASIRNIVNGMLKSYEGTDLFKDISESIKSIIKEEYFKYYGKENGYSIMVRLSKKYGVSISFIKSIIYVRGNNR